MSNQINSQEIISDWLKSFSKMLSNGEGSIDNLFLEQSFWRDHLALTWDLRTFAGLEKIKESLQLTKEKINPINFSIMEGQEAVLVEPAPNMKWIESFIQFETKTTDCNGVLRLMQDKNNEWKAWLLFTASDQFKDFPEKRNINRVTCGQYAENPTNKTWLEDREERIRNISKAKVLVVGAGQAGLMIAARLEQLNINTLVVEKNGRIGDNWRNRYRSLTLHDPVWYDHFPYLKFPPNWPVFTPKDKLAQWMESYADIMELNVKTSTEVVHTLYHEQSKTWEVGLSTNNKSVDVITVNHIILATGLSGPPRVPNLKNRASYEGVCVHSSQFKSGFSYKGKKAIVIGCGNSGHDIAHSLYEAGADVTMVERSSSFIINRKTLVDAFGAFYAEESQKERPVELTDLLFAGFPIPVLFQMQEGGTQLTNESDKELLTKLKNRGFKVKNYDDGAAIFKLYLKEGGKYYLNTGCSELIADGKINLKQGVEIESFTKNGLRFEDGEELSAQIIILATGYANMKENAKLLLGNKLGEKCKDVWNVDEEGEMNAMWKHSGLDHFWFMGGNLAGCRFYSKFLAMRIKAIEEGLIEPTQTFLKKFLGKYLTTEKNSANYKKSRSNKL